MKLCKKYFELTHNTKLDFKLGKLSVIFFAYISIKGYSKVMDMDKNGKLNNFLLHMAVLRLLDCPVPLISVY